MANENTTEGPLTATLGEQLAGKGHADELEQARARVAAPGAPARAAPRRSTLRMPRWSTLAGAAVAYGLASAVWRRLRRWR